MLPRDTEWSTHPWSPHAISGVPDFVSCTQFFSKHDPNCKRPQRLNKAFLFWASCWFPLEMVAHCKVAVWSQCCLPLPHYIRLPKKYWGVMQKKRILCFRFVLSLNLQPYVIVILSQCVSAALQTQCSGHCCTAIWLHNATKKFTINTYRRTSARSMRAANISHLQCGMQLLKLRKGSG